MKPQISDDQALDLHRTIANGIVKKLNAVQKPGPVGVAVEMIAKRLIASGDSLAVLRRNSPHDYAFDVAAILRNIYDVMLQGLFMMVDTAKREQRAQLYLDFMHIERKRRIALMDRSETDLARRFSESPMRATGEPEIERRFNEIKAEYLTKKGRVRDTWYPGTLRDVAKAAGYEAEYELMQRFLSGVIHSSPLTLEEGPIVQGFLALDWHWRFAFRILGVYADYKEVDLDTSEMDSVDSAKRNVFDFP